jgi:hypothetical protein
MNQTRRRSYYAGHYRRDKDRLQSHVRTGFIELRSHLKRLQVIEFTALERVIHGARDDLQHNPSPVFRALLHHLPSSDVFTPQSLEPTLVCLVHILDSGSSQLICKDHNSASSDELHGDLLQSSADSSVAQPSPSRIKKKLVFSDADQPTAKRMKTLRFQY